MKQLIHLGFAFAAIAVIFLILNFALPLCPEPIGSRADLFITGAKLTLVLTFYAGVIGLLLGTLAGVAKLQKNLLLRGVATFYTWLFRGTPLLVQILFIYFALPVVSPSFQFDEQTAAIIALALNVGAYNAEAIRGGLIAVPKGQTEAAVSLGLSPVQTLVWITLPQAFRISIPPLVSNLVALLKDSSLASSIGLLELSLVGNRVSSETFSPVPVLLTVAGIYLVITSVLTAAALPLEKKVRGEK
ncbi:MAG TPA: amino acid ABC transporter permease [Oligoflexia bacterium]|nr:amino acid ABC transporter permease [Oligoflexia bacterium]